MYPAGGFQTWGYAPRFRRPPHSPETTRDGLVPSAGHTGRLGCFPTFFCYISRFCGIFRNESRWIEILEPQPRKNIKNMIKPILMGTNQILQIEIFWDKTCGPGGPGPGSVAPPLDSRCSGKASRYRWFCETGIFQNAGSMTSWSESVVTSFSRHLSQQLKISTQSRFVAVVWPTQCWSVHVVPHAFNFTRWSQVTMFGGTRIRHMRTPFSLQTSQWMRGCY